MNAKRLLLLLGLAVSVSACGALLVEHYPYGRGYPDGRPSNAAVDYASRTGYHDGYQVGYDDGRDRDRFEPRNSRRYRAADHGYRRDLYISRDYFADLYRRGFIGGYEAGYRQGQEDRRRRRG